MHVLHYFQTGTWQTLAAAGSAMLSCVLMIVAYRQAHKQRGTVAGYWMLLGTVIIFAGAELTLAGSTWFFLLGGLLLIGIIGSYALGQQWVLVLVLGALFAGIILLISWFEPLPRLNMDQFGPMAFQFASIIAMLAAVAIWQMIRILRGIGTIRSRLLVSFVLVVSLTAIGVGTVSIVIGYQYSRQQVVDSLDVIATLKESQLNAWVQSLGDELASLALEERSATVASYARLLLTAPTRDEDPGTGMVLFGNILRTRLQEVIEQTQRFDDIFVLDRDGIVVVSTDPTQEGLDLSAQPYFERGLLRPDFQPPFLSPVSGQTAVVAVQPISDQYGNVLGVLAGRVGMEPIRRVLNERTGLGSTGVTYLVGLDYVVLPLSRRGDAEQGEMRSPGIEQALLTRGTGSDNYEDYRGVPVVGTYRWLPDLEASLLGEQSQTEAFGAVYGTLAISAGVSVLFVLLAVGASLLITRSIADPLAALVDTATQIAGGDLDRVATVERADEIGTLAQAFNTMTAQLRDLIGGLERRVAERTHALEDRSAFLEASAAVGRAASSILETEELMHQVVELICNLFGLYYVGMFLVDETGEWAVLRAGAGNTGRPLPAQGRQLPVNGNSMIGWSIINRQARVAQEASEDTVRVPAPELPDTRSEAALPLQSRGQVLGALTVQHTEPDAFDQETVIVLQTMADQVATALANARLFADRQDALIAAQRAYGELSREAWRELLSTRVALGYRSDATGITDASDIWRPEMEQALVEGRVVRSDGADDDGRIPLAIPIKVRGEVVGVLDTYKPAEAGDWTTEELALLEDVVEQLDVALESARLHQDAQRQATREQTIRRVTEQMRRRRDVESILQSTLAELTRALGVPRAYVRLGTEDELSAARAKSSNRERDQAGHSETEQADTEKDSEKVAPHV
jgi:GAF domain-containing protein